MRWWRVAATQVAAGSLLPKKIFQVNFSVNKIINQIKFMVKRTGRAKPMTAKAGVTKTKRRYACGGKMKK